MLLAVAVLERSVCSKLVFGLVLPYWKVFVVLIAKNFVLENIYSIYLQWRWFVANNPGADIFFLSRLMISLSTRRRSIARFIASFLSYVPIGINSARDNIVFA